MLSISRYGFAKYLSELESLSRKYPEMILIPGVETAPFYYWEGSLLKHSLKIKDWHRHILVVGITEAQDLESLPNVANPLSLLRSLAWYDVFRLFPFALLALGLFLFFRRECHYTDEKGLVCSRFALRWRITGIVIGILGILFIINENPFMPVSYDQYEQDLGYRPYQALIDYARNHGGLTFWSHPEAAYVAERDGVAIETAAHPEALLETTGYTGFCIFMEGDDVVGKPGGQWDQTLLEFCRGERKTPVWAVTGMAFDTGDREELIGRMKRARTCVLGNVLNRYDVMDAMRWGRMYASVGGGERPLILQDFSLLDSSSGQEARIANLFFISGSVIVTVRADEEGWEERIEEDGALDKEGPMEGPKEGPKDTQIQLIRNGEVIKTERVSVPVRFIHIDTKPVTERSFYRVVIKRGGQTIATNPIFVEMKKIRMPQRDEEE
jgi:hypothetical protein